jgi:hypothetical protein
MTDAGQSLQCQFQALFSAIYNRIAKNAQLRDRQRPALPKQRMGRNSPLSPLYPLKGAKGAILGPGRAMNGRPCLWGMNYLVEILAEKI